MEILLIFISAIFVNNVVLSQFLGVCPFLGVSKKVGTAVGMTAAVTFVMAIATLVTWLLQYYVLVPLHIEFLQTVSFILVIASLVQMVEIIIKKISPSLYQALGIFLPLIVVNCVILGRAEAFASKNRVGDSALDGVGIGLGFTIALTAVGLVREILGSGSAFGWKFISGDGMLAFVLAPGAFIVLAYLMVVFRKITKNA